MKTKTVMDYKKEKKVSPAVKAFNLSCIGIAEKLHAFMVEYIEENKHRLKENELIVIQGELLFYKDIIDQINEFPEQDIVIQTHLYNGMRNAIVKFTGEFNKHMKVFMGRYEECVKDNTEIKITDA